MEERTIGDAMDVILGIWPEGRERVVAHQSMEALCDALGIPVDVIETTPLDSLRGGLA